MSSSVNSGNSQIVPCISPAQDKKSNATEGQSVREEEGGASNVRPSPFNLTPSLRPTSRLENEDETKAASSEGDKTDLALSPPSTSRQSRSVQFEEGVMDHPQSIVSFSKDNSVSVHDLVAKIEKLNVRLSDTRIDLSGERVMRKKKERNLVKLAKELGKRTSEAANADDKIKELETSLADLQSKLKEEEEQGRRREREMMEAQQTYRAVSREYDTTLAESKRQHEMICMQLQQELVQANLLSDRLRAKLAVLQDGLDKNSDKTSVATDVSHVGSDMNEQFWEEEKEELTSESTATINPQMPKMQLSLRSSFASKKMCQLALATLATLAAAIAVATRVVNMGHLQHIALPVISLWQEAVCGPVAPGFLRNYTKEETVTMEFPWWTSVGRDPVFSVMGCPERRTKTASRLSWTKGRLVLHDGERTKTRRASGISVRGPAPGHHGTTISLLNAHGHVVDKIVLTAAG